jgi:hypothetical protein
MSCAGILVLLLAVSLIWVAFSRDRDPTLGVVGLLLAPCLLIAGWTIGNRRLGSPASIEDPGWRIGKAAPSDSSPDEVEPSPPVRTITFPPDGRIVGKAGLGCVALVVAAIVALDVILTIAFRNLPGV